MIYVFKTSVKTKQAAKLIGKLLSKRKEINSWNFDLKDCDHILRVDCLAFIHEEIIKVVTSNGFDCEEL